MNRVFLLFLGTLLSVHAQYSPYSVPLFIANSLASNTALCGLPSDMVTTAGINVVSTQSYAYGIWLAEWAWALENCESLSDCPSGYYVDLPSTMNSGPCSVGSNNHQSHVCWVNVVRIVSCNTDVNPDCNEPVEDTLADWIATWVVQSEGCVLGVVGPLSSVVSYAPLVCAGSTDSPVRFDERLALLDSQLNYPSPGNLDTLDNLNSIIPSSNYINYYSVATSTQCLYGSLATVKSLCYFSYVSGQSATGQTANCGCSTTDYLITGVTETGFNSGEFPIEYSNCNCAFNQGGTYCTLDCNCGTGATNWLSTDGLRNCLCTCDPHWSGTLCQNPRCGVNNVCSNHGTCTSLGLGSSYACTCQDGWGNFDCSVPYCNNVSPFIGPACLNGGSCNETTSICACPAGFMGRFCQYPCASLCNGHTQCQYNPANCNLLGCLCSGHGTSITGLIPNQSSCLCDTDYVGSQCQHEKVSTIAQCNQGSQFLVTPATIYPTNIAFCVANQISCPYNHSVYSSFQSSCIILLGFPVVNNLPCIDTAAPRLLNGVLTCLALDPGPVYTSGNFNDGPVQLSLTVNWVDTLSTCQSFAVGFIFINTISGNVTLQNFVTGVIGNTFTFTALQNPPTSHPYRSNSVLFNFACLSFGVYGQVNFSPIIALCTIAQSYFCGSVP